MPKLKPRSKYGKVFGERHYAWKGDLATVKSKRERAITLYELGDCEDCGKPARDRHHKDGNTGNNAPSNIAILCRRCHMAADGRLAKFRYIPTILPPKPCKTCGLPSKPLRRGLCHKCNEYLRRNGKPRPKNLQPRKIIDCPECTRKGVRSVKGLCYWCYAAQWARNKRRGCHSFIHSRPKYAREAGFLK